MKAFTDGPSLLRATSDGSINVSAFASWAYLEAYNKSKSNTGLQVALAGNLNVLKDSLYHEKIDQSTKNNINVLATAKKNKNNAAYKKLGKLYHNKQIQKWIAKKYSGTKVEVNKPVSYLTD